MADKSKGVKFPLSIYRHWGGMLRLPSLLIAIAGGLVWWFAPTSEDLADYDWVFLVIGAIGAFIFFYSLWVRQRAYVQCLPDYIRICTPFFSLVVSYKRVMQVRPTEFHSQFSLDDMNGPQRRLLGPFMGRTAIILELSSFPVGERRMHAWLPWFMFASEVPGFVLMVEDWMALSRQLSVFTDRWVVRRQEDQRPPTSYLR